MTGHVGQIGRILDGGDHLAQQGGDDVAVGLGQDDIDHDLHRAEALGVACLKLAVGHGVQAAADDLRR